MGRARWLREASLRLRSQLVDTFVGPMLSYIALNARAVMRASLPALYRFGNLWD